jgi:tetratricopeptide (TPR) repeat protein
MNAPIDSICSYESIDQMSESLNSQLERVLTPGDVGLSPKEEFRGHCSNLQVWVEHDYDTCLLHRNLAFPLLKQLASIGDDKARELFCAEVEKRFKSGHPTVQMYLILEEYLLFLDRSVLEELVYYVDHIDVLKFLSECFNDKNDFSNHVKTLKRVMWIDPIHRKAYLVLAFTYLKSNKLLKAKLALKELLKMYPRDEEALFFLASLYWFEGKKTRANELIRQIRLKSLPFPSRSEFIKIKAYIYSSLVIKPRYKKRLYHHKPYLDIP